MEQRMEMQRERLQALFEKNGLRNTSQRQTIYEYLIQTDCHPTAKQIYDHLKPGHPSLSLATAYNTLDLLVGAGLITALGEIGDNQVHYDGNTSTHINLACTQCFKILDMPDDTADSIETVIEKSGFDIHGSRIMYYGICPDCQPKQTQISKEI